MKIIDNVIIKFVFVNIWLAPYLHLLVYFWFN